MEINKETFDQLMDVNVFGPLKVSEAFSKNVIASEKKQIIVLSSIIGSIGMRNSPTPLPSLAISKAAVNMAMKTEPFWHVSGKHKQLCSNSQIRAWL